MNQQTTRGADHSNHTRASMRTAAFVGLIVLLAVAVRVYRLDAQSAWYDDYNGLAGFQGRGFVSFIMQSLDANPHSMPLYYVLQYFASFVFGSSALGMRLLSVLLGALTVPVIFLIGRDFFGRRAGFIASVCFALSPIHVFHDQSIRQYPLFVLLAAVSIYALLQVARGGGWRWWAVSAIASALVVWTHIFGVFLPLAEACYLILFPRRWGRQTLAWGGGQAVLLLPCLLWLHIMPQVDEYAFHHFHAPGLKQVFLDVVADDATGKGTEVVPDGRTWQCLPETCVAALRGLRDPADYALAAAFTLALAWAMVRAARSLWRRQPAPEVLLLAIAIIPVLGLTALSYAWRPCIYPRYTVYSSLALYALLGGMLSCTARKSWWVPGLVIVLALYAYQLSFVLPAATRTDWLGAAQLIRTQAKPEDLVLVGGSHTAYPELGIFCFNMGPTALPVEPAHTLQAVCDKSECYLRPHPPGERSVWYVINRRYEWFSLRNIEACLTARGLRFDHTLFPSMEHLSVFRIQTTDAPMPENPISIDVKVDYAKMLGDMGVRVAGERLHEAVFALLRRVYEDDAALPADQLLPRLGYHLIEEGAFNLVIAAAHQDLRTHPNTFDDYMLLASALYSSGDVDGSFEAARRAAEIEPRAPDPHLAIALALFKKGDLEHSAESLRTAQRVAWELRDVLIDQAAPILSALYDRDLAKARTAAYRAREQNAFLPRGLLMEAGLELWLTPCN